MSTNPTKRRPAPKPSAKRRPQARKGRTALAAKQARRGSDKTAWIAAAVIIAIGASLVVAFASKSGTHDTTGGTGASPAPAGLVSAVTSIPTSIYSQIGTGSVTGPPKKLDGALLTNGGKPRIVYIGSEYCPYCATERWAMVAALSRFGTFKNLKVTTSSTSDVFPSTHTFSFHGSTYSSPYISFEAVEQYTNIQQGSSYKPLDKATPEQLALMTKYDAPPYVNQSDAGAIPFIDFANQYLIEGATYGANTLQGKSWDEIAAAMKDSTTDIAKGAIGSANVMTSTICKLTHDKPANVCSDPTIQGIERNLPH